MHELSVNELASLVWSFATLLVRDPPACLAVQLEAEARAMEFGAWGLASMLWAFATLRELHEDK
eukprot:2867508-Amphidinium_carterae.1